MHTGTKRTVAATVTNNLVNVLGADDRPNSMAQKWKWKLAYVKLRNLRCAGWIGTCKYASLRSIDVRRSPSLIHPRIDLRDCILNRQYRINLLSCLRFKIPLQPPELLGTRTEWNRTRFVLFLPAPVRWLLCPINAGPWHPSADFLVDAEIPGKVGNGLEGWIRILR